MLKYNKYITVKYVEFFVITRVTLKSANNYPGNL